MRQEYYSMRLSETIKDGTWYHEIPLWVLAEKQKLLTASFYWVGSEADIEDTLPTYYYSYNESIPIDRRIEEVKNWLALPQNKRPHLITFYRSEEHTSELQSRGHLVCRLLLERKKQ